MTDFTTEPCRSCSAPVIWCETERGKSMPVDAEPSANATIAVDAREGRQPLARVVGAKHAFGRSDLRTSHFASCPDSATWRRKRGAA